MTQEVVVAIGEGLVEVGTVRFGVVRQKEVSYFRYAERWLDDDKAFALEPALPLMDQWFHFAGGPDDPGAGVPAVFQDCAPDAWGRSIIERTVSPSAEMDYLLAVDDRTRVALS